MEGTGATGIIVADPLIIETCKRVAPKLEIHLSTQQSLSNVKAVEYWKSEGLERVVLARETSAEEIKEMKEKLISRLRHSFMVQCVLLILVVVH